MNRFAVICCTAIVALWNPAPEANTFSTPAEYSDERALFAQAKSALARGNKTQFKIAKQALSDYPLYPYLEYAEQLTPRL